MNAKQAKDFLVQQTTEQAALEDVPLSDLEKRMMYSTESDDSCENPIELDAEFETQHDTAEYEAKISRLLHHARERLKEQHPERARDWDRSIRTLRKGDHYILVLWDVEPPSEHPIRDFLKPVGLGMLLAMGFGIAVVLALEYNINLDRFRKYLPAANPRLALFLFIGLVLLAVGGFHLFNRVLLGWFQRRAKEDKEPR